MNHYAQYDQGTQVSRPEHRWADVADKFRTVFGVGLLASCLVGTLAYFGVKLPAAAGIVAAVAGFVVGALLIRLRR
jgi:hypothetical protein